MKNILIATEKPFDGRVVQQMKEEVERQSDYRLTILEKYTDKAALLEAAAKAEALIIRSDKIDREVIEAAKNLKIIVRAGAGYDNVDLEAATENNIVVMNTPGQNSNAVAELVFGLMLTVARNKYGGTSGHELRGKTIGLQGYGNIGKYVAVIAKGFGMKVKAFDPFVVNFAIDADGIDVTKSVEELYQGSDFISLQFPANETTTKSVNYNLLKNLKGGATVINTARKEIIDEEGMLQIMADRPDIKYVADITPDAKAEFEEKFMDRVFFTTKKMGAQTFEANLNAGMAAVNQIHKFFEIDDRTFQVN